MKVSREQMAENRRRILDAAAGLFRQRGFEAVTVAEIMKAAGLTHGGFYGHFESKEDLIAQAFAHVLAPAEGGGAGFDPAAYAAYYLSPSHRDDPANACLFATLGTEAARASAQTRHAMTEALRRQIDLFSRAAPDETEAERRRAAIARWSAMVGALMIARLVDDPALSDEVMEETRRGLAVSG